MNHQDRIPTLAKEMVRFWSAKEPDNKDIKEIKKVMEVEKMLANIKDVLNVARPHIVRLQHPSAPRAQQDYG